MMAAHFRELVIYQLWEELYDVEWQFACIDGGWAAHGAAPGSGEPLLHFGTPAGDRHLSEQPW